MPLSMSIAIRYGVKSALLSMGIEPELAEHIGCITILNMVAAVAADHGYLVLTQESQEKISEAIDFELDPEFGIHSEAIHGIKNVGNEYEYTLNDIDSNKTEEIFSQIDLAQARINKEQEEIQSLAEETDILLNQLANKAS